MSTSNQQTGSVEVQYSYALDGDGSLTHIDDAERSEPYTCPGCKGALAPVLGELRAKHFRHIGDSCSLESYLHKCAKEAFFHRYQQSLALGEPIELILERAVVCTSERFKLLRSSNQSCRSTIAARYDLTRIFGQAALERFDRTAGFQPDVMLYDESTGRRCYVEIFVTHSCSQEKIETGIPILEFEVTSEADIQYLMSGLYSVNDKCLRTYNFQPESRSKTTCSGSCSMGDTEMSVWSLGNNGRLQEHTTTLRKVDLTTCSQVNAWPKSLASNEQLANLRAFLRGVDPNSAFPNCTMCKHSTNWEDGYLPCRRKAKRVPYTEAHQCAFYEIVE